MNQYGYNELYMHSQRDPDWDQVHLGHSNATMHGFGCLVSVIAYLCSRVLARDITPGEMVNWLNANDGFDRNGQLVYDAIHRFTGGKLWLSSTWNPLGARFTVKCVNFAGLTHYVVALLNPLSHRVDIEYDPWQWPPSKPGFTFVQPGNKYPDFRIPRRLYFKTN